MNYIQMRHIHAANSGEKDTYREPQDRPYVRIVLNEGQVPLIVRAIRREEFALRQTFRRLDGETPEAIGYVGVTRDQAQVSLRAQMKALKMTRTLVIAEALARGWYL